MPKAGVQKGGLVLSDLLPPGLDPKLDLNDGGTLCDAVSREDAIERRLSALNTSGAAIKLATHDLPDKLTQLTERARRTVVTRVAFRCMHEEAFGSAGPVIFNLNVPKLADALRLSETEALEEIAACIRMFPSPRLASLTQSELTEGKLAQRYLERRSELGCDPGGVLNDSSRALRAVAMVVQELKTDYPWMSQRFDQVAKTQTKASRIVDDGLRCLEIALEPDMAQISIKPREINHQLTVLRSLPTLMNRLAGELDEAHRFILKDIRVPVDELGDRVEGLNRLRNGIGDAIKAQDWDALNRLAEKLIDARGVALAYGTLRLASIEAAQSDIGAELCVQARIILEHRDLTTSDLAAHLVWLELEELLPIDASESLMEVLHSDLMDVRPIALPTSNIAKLNNWKQNELTELGADPELAATLHTKGLDWDLALTVADAVVINRIHPTAAAKLVRWEGGRLVLSEPDDIKRFFTEAAALLRIDKHQDSFNRCGGYAEWIEATRNVVREYGNGSRRKSK